ncbi:hypothetical protein Tco_0980228 [Tanacetum coccineum]
MNFLHWLWRNQSMQQSCYISLKNVDANVVSCMFAMVWSAIWGWFWCGMEFGVIKVCSSLEGYSGLVLAWQGNCIWEALGGNAHDLDSIWEETRQDYNFTRSGFKDARTVPGWRLGENENPIRTIGDYSRPSHEGYRNTIELSDGNNVVPLRSDTIRLVQSGYSFHGLRSEDPNQHIKEFLKLVDSLDLDVANRERTRLRVCGELEFIDGPYPQRPVLRVEEPISVKMLGLVDMWYVMNISKLGKMRHDDDITSNRLEHYVDIIEIISFYELCMKVMHLVMECLPKRIEKFNMTVCHKFLDKLHSLISESEMNQMSMPRSTVRQKRSNFIHQKGTCDFPKRTQHITIGISNVDACQKMFKEIVHD